jgi:hypothetical protein
MLWIRAPVRVAKQAVVAKEVAIGPRDRRADRQCELRQGLGLEDALLAHQRDALPVELEPLQEQRPGEDVAMDRRLLRQPGEGRKPYPRISEVRDVAHHRTEASLAPGGLTCGHWRPRPALPPNPLAAGRGEGTKGVLPALVRERR